MVKGGVIKPTGDTVIVDRSDAPVIRTTHSRPSIEAVVSPQEPHVQCFGVTAIPSKQWGYGAHTRKMFVGLARKWERETNTLSAVWQIKQHPCFLELVKLGKEIVPYALERIAKYARWHLVLLELADTPPDLSRAGGDIDKLREAWKEWGETHGIAGQVVSIQPTAQSPVLTFYCNQPA